MIPSQLFSYLGLEILYVTPQVGHVSQSTRWQRLTAVSLIFSWDVDYVSERSYSWQA